MVHIILIAFAVSMDTFAVSVVGGAVKTFLSFFYALKIALVFGIFHVIMPIIGWLCGVYFIKLISSFDHWVASLLLVGIGGKMLYEAYHNGSNGDIKATNMEDIRILFLLGIAVSIDSFGVGLSFAILKVEIIRASLLMGAIVFGVSFVGVYLGKFTGTMLRKKAEFLGGIVLIGIGVKILLEHLGII